VGRAAGRRGEAGAAAMRLGAEVCVIGTGAGGGAAACALAEGGKDVVLLEAGPHHTAADMDQREDSMLPKLFAEDGRRATVEGGIPILQGRCVGGSTTHNTGYIYRAPRGILERWRREGFEASDGEVDAMYRDLERSIGVVECREEDVNPHNEVVRRGARALGWRVRRADHNRAPGCSGCGYCILGCAYNRKLGSMLTFVPRAVARGARLVANAVAHRIAPTSRGGYVVHGRLDDRKEPFVVEAARVVVACGAIESPLLLRRSGLARGGPLGRTLRLHPAAPVGALFAEDLVAWRGVPQSVMVEEFASFFETGVGGYLLMPANATPALTSVVLPGVGLEHRALMRELPRFASGAVLLHDETRGTVTPRGLWDLRPKIRYWPEPREVAELKTGIRNLAKLYFAAGARRVLLPFRDAPPVESEGGLDRALENVRAEPHLVALSSVHPQCTCPLGRDPREAVVRPDLTLHDPVGRGISVADASVFPSSVGVPPQLTIMLAGLLAARRILAS
jgi:choline dehydrogenase-like flavoprotein